MSLREYTLDAAAVKQLIKDSIDPDLLLSSLGFKVTKNTSKELRSPCVIHGGDNPTGFCYKKDSGRFRCYTHGCEKDEDGTVNNDIFSLVQKVRQCSFLEALKYAADLCGISVDGLGEADDETRFMATIRKEEREFVALQKQIESTKSVVNAALVGEAIKRGSPYFESKGVSAESVAKFNLGTYRDRDGHERAMVPIYSSSSDLVGYSGRATNTMWKELGIPKYDINYGFVKNDYLYNMDKAKLFFEAYFFIILVEGFKGVWHLDNCGYPNTVAVMGSTLLEGQARELIIEGINKVLLFFDWDLAGQAGYGETERILNDFGIDYGIIRPEPSLRPTGYQPDHFSAAIIDKLVEVNLAADERQPSDTPF